MTLLRQPPVRLMLILLLSCSGWLSITLAQPVTPPPRPRVPPLIGATYSNDRNGDRIDDELAERAQQELVAVTAALTPEELSQHAARLGGLVEVELIFNEPVKQSQLDTFLSQGGQISYVYKAVSYGWNGWLPLEKVIAMPVLLGDSLLLLQESRPARMHLDLATRNGRVRPIWASGFGGNPSGFDGSSNITIAIVDSGVDESHTDLTGRRVYWHDFSSDNSPNPVDISQHGSHVASIAVGTGAAGGAGTGNFFLSDENSLSGVPNGSFFPSLFDLPATSITCTITARWNGGGSTTLHLASHAKGSSSSFSSHGSTNGTSPLTLVVTVTGDPTRAYTAALLASGTTSDYVVTSQISNYPGSGDGFNRFRGVAPGCNWAGAKVFDNAGNGSTTEIGAALDELVNTRVQNNIKVLNLSLGFVGNPGIATSIRQKVNTAVNNGIVAVTSAGNDGAAQSPGGREIDDPGRAAMTLTVAAANDVNQLTDYSSSGFASPGSVPGQEEDYKPDLMAPGGSSFYTFITAADSNSGDGAAFADQRANDYFNISGTSMASPFAAGCAALVIDALQQSGITWDFNSNQHSRLVKMLLCATASESNAIRENNKNNPTLQRAAGGPNGFPAGKDAFEGYGMINPDAAVEAASQVYTNGSMSMDTLGPGVNDRRVWARTVGLGAGQNLGLNLTVPSGGDFDLYLYSRAPSAYGTPVLLASSTLAGLGVNEALSFTPTANTNLLLVVKRISGSGTFTLNSSGPPVPPVVDFRGGPTNGSAPLAVTFTNLTTGATNHSWTFGDGSVSSIANPVHTYTNAGVYNVALTSIGPGGTNSLTRSNYVTVTNVPLPVASFVCSPTNGAAPLNVAFTNLSSDASSYQWNFGDGDTGTATNPSHTYTNPGTYTVSLTAIGSGGTNTVTRTNLIVVSPPPPPVAGFTAVSTSGAAPFSVSFVNSSTGASSYSWDFGDGTGSTVTNPAHIYNGAGVYSVSLTAIGAGGTNTVTRSNYIEVTNAPPLIVSQPQSQVVNLGANATFAVTATGTPPLFYQWFFNGTNLAAGTASVYTRTNAQFTDAGDYSVLISNVVGNALSSNATLSVTPISGVIPITGVPYAENFDSMGASGTGTPFGWYVGTGTGAISDTNVTVGNGSINTGGNYNFGSTGSPDRALGSLASNSTQRDTEARFLNISGLLIDSFIISYAGEQWRVGGNGAVNNDLVLQYSTDGVNFVPLGAPFDFNTPVDSGAAGALDGNAPANRVTAIGGTYTPAVAITNGQIFFLRWVDVDNSSADNAMAIDDLSISFNLTNPPPVIADFTAQPTSGAVPLMVNFTNLSSGASNYSWDFGDGTSSSIPSPVHTYTNAGAYSVNLTAVGPGGSNTLTLLSYVVVTNPPPPVIVDFTAQPTSGAVPLTVNFTNLSSGASSYSWDFGDGTSSSIASPVHIYTNAGAYSVSLTAVGPGGSNALSLLSYVVVTNPPPVIVDFIAQPTNGAVPLTVNFTNLSSGASSYSWDFGDGTGSSIPSPVHIYTNAGAYSVSLTAVGPGGSNMLSLLSYIEVTNPPPPVIVDFTAQPTNGAVPLMVNFTNLSSGASSYLWDFGDGTGSSIASPVHIYTNAGAFSVSLTAVGPGGSNTLSLLGYIVVTNPPPPVIVDFTAQPTNGAVPLTVNFTNLSSGASSYIWDFGDGTGSSIASPVHTYTNAGAFSVSLTAVGPGGSNALTLLSYIEVTNPPPPVIVDFTAQPTNGAVPLMVNFTNLSSGASSYSWDFGDGTSSSIASPVHIYTNAGAFSVSLTAVGPGGSNTLTLLSYIEVTNPPPPVIVDFTAQPTNGAVPLTVNFTNLSSGASSYLWDFGDGTGSSIPSPVHIYTNAGAYSVNLTAVGPGGSNTLTGYIVVTNPPPPAIASFVAGPTNGVAPLTVWFTNLSTGTLAYRWDFGDGNVSTDENPSNVFTNSGNYTVSLTAFGLESTNTLTRVNYIVVQTAPPLVLTGELSGTNFVLSFESVAGKTYDVEYKGALSDSSWQFLQSVSGNGSTIRITNSQAISGELYYRLKMQ